MSSLSQRLLALHDLHVRGFLTDAQFALAKRHEIERTGPVPGVAAGPPPPIPVIAPPPLPPGPALGPPPPLNPVVPGVGLALGAASIANGGLTG